MIPVKLEIQGLYSYKDTQVVDFEQLTAAGLFGIFGAVGSGKSSILEAILLALYGSTERLSDRGEKNSMLNLQCDHLLINFEFRGGQNNSQRFLARYSARRNRKNFDDVKPAEHTFYELIDGNPIPVEQRGEAILGMKKEHFKQTVIIPQGKFREFIDLTPGPRADMMKELFGLERFDLAPKTGTLVKAVREDKIRLETQLNALESINISALEEKKTTLEELKNTVDDARKNLDKTVTTYQKQQGLQKNYHQLSQFKTEWIALEKNRPEIEEKKKVREEIEKAKSYLKPLWESLTEENKELEKYRISAIDCARFRENFEKEIQTLEEEEKSLREKADNRPERETKIRDLTKVLEIQKLLQEQKATEKKLETLQPSLETLKAAQQSFGTRIRKLEYESDNLSVVSSLELADWRSDVKDWIQWEDQLKKLNSENQKQQIILNGIQDSISAILRQLPEEEPDFDAWRQTQKKLIQNLETSKDHLVQRQGLGAHAHLLVSGERCPLCGSVDHPQPLEPGFEAQEFSKCNDEVRKAKELMEKIISSSENINAQRIRLEHQESVHADNTAERLRVKVNLEALQLKNATRGINSLDALNRQLTHFEKAVKDKELVTNEIKSLRVKSEENRIAFEEASDNLQKFNQQSITLSTSISIKTEEIKDSLFCKPFYEKESSVIQETIQKVKRDIEETAFKLESKRKVLQETRTKQATNLASLDHYTNLRDQSEQKIKRLESDFVDAMEKHGFSDRNKLATLIGSSLDLGALDREIRLFEDRCLLVKNRMDELNQEEGVKDFDPNAFIHLEKTMHSQKEFFTQTQQAFILLEQQIVDDKKKMIEKEALQKDLEKLSQRESYLKELVALFQGSGFVKYVSGIYLKELCNTANLRFRKLTKNSLSLEVDENNTFWVMDYLNGGKKRLLKTLSGGQTFQASLCLALALAEKVKALNQADQSFFFLDEGFGALDRISLRVVFETLKSLRQENRIVGIISHVEELQQEIEVYAKVVLDTDLGSQVSYSFR